MSDDTTFRWEQDGAGGDHGTAQYFFLGGSVTLRIDTFAKAFELNQAIALERENVTYEARKTLLREIAIESRTSCLPRFRDHRSPGVLSAR